MIAVPIMGSHTLVKMARRVFDAAVREFRRSPSLPQAKDALAAATTALYYAGNIGTTLRRDLRVAAADAINEATTLVDAVLNLRGYQPRKAARS